MNAYQRSEARACVLVPVYNNARGLAQSLASIREEDHPLEVLVVDDGSRQPQELDEVVRGFAHAQVIHLARNQGIAAALNAGLRMALESGFEFIGRLDTSDLAAPGRFSRQMEFLEAHRECGLVGSSIEFVDESYRRLFIYEAPAEHPAIMRALHIENCLIHSGVMIRSDVLRVVGGYREDLQASEDYELFLRIGRAARVATLSEVLTTCVRARRGISVARRKSQQLERLKLQLAHFDGLETASYYGVCRTVASMCCPYGLCERVKASLGNIGRA